MAEWINTAVLQWLNEDWLFSFFFQTVHLNALRNAADLDDEYLKRETAYLKNFVLKS